MYRLLANVLAKVSNVNDIVIPFLFGALQVGCATHRQLAVHYGQYVQVFLCNVGVSVAYYQLIQYGASRQITPFIAFSLGACMITSWQSWRRRGKA
jgi:hypothetical protein